MKPTDRQRRLSLLLVLMLALSLAGRRGGGWVFRGFHDDQDRALLGRLERRLHKNDHR